MRIKQTSLSDYQDTETNMSDYPSTETNMFVIVE
jgi:hypothetical protein